MILLVGINSKFTHTSLSVRTLARNSGSDSVRWIEHTINEPVGNVAREIFNLKPDVICFSCYIWNIEFVICVAEILSKTMMDAKIVLGGPEVTFDSAAYMEKYPFVDMIIRGEGEKIFSELIKSNFLPDNILGITYRAENKIVKAPDGAPIENLDRLVFPYTDEDLEENRGKLIYYESSRGCPFNCSYCLSSTIKNVRYKSIEKTISELKILIDKKVKIIKFVDRTFNSDKKRAYELVKFMKSYGTGTTFHFEIAAHIITDEFLELIADAPPGMFQFEIGVQSTNPKTIEQINRKTDFDTLSKTVKALVGKTNVAVHLDLIAGLPYENYDSFTNSFNEVMALRPHVLQLGFLKLLRGTKIRDEKEKFSYGFESFPPYEVVNNRFISYAEIIIIKGVEEVLEFFYNSGAFFYAVDYLISSYSDSYSLFYDISLFFQEKGYQKVAHSRKELYDILAEFAMGRVDDIFYDFLKLDWFLNNKNVKTPSWSFDKYDMELHKNRISVIEDMRDELPREMQNMNVRELLKITHFERFSYDVAFSKNKEKAIYLFCYKENKASNPIKIRREIV